MYDIVAGIPVAWMSPRQCPAKHFRCETVGKVEYLDRSQTFMSFRFCVWKKSVRDLAFYKHRKPLIYTVLYTFTICNMHMCHEANQTTVYILRCGHDKGSINQGLTLPPIMPLHLKFGGQIFCCDSHVRDLATDSNTRNDSCTLCLLLDI